MNNDVENAVWLAKRMLVDSIWKAALVEGLGTTFPKTECILNGIKADTTYEEATFIINMKRAWEFVIEHYSEANDLMFLRTLHEITCKGIVRNAGDFRTGIVKIGGCKYIPEIPVVDNVYNTLKVIDLKTSGMQKALTLFCYLAKSQLFWDGNKRMAQLMANKVLIQEGIGILSVPEECRQSFSIALVLYYETGDAEDLCNYLVRHCIQRIS